MNVEALRKSLHASPGCWHLLGRPTKTATASPAKKATTAPKPVAPVQRAIESKPASAPERPIRRLSASAFAHLLQPAAHFHDENAIGALPSVTLPTKPMGGLAKEIIAAGAKAKTPAGTGVPSPTGLAADILAAGRRRRALAG